MIVTRRNVSAAPLLLLCLAFNAVASGTSEVPDPAEVMRRVVERAGQVARAPEAKPYTYDKRTLVEELDAQGRVVKSTDKLYKVVLVSGWPFPRLVRIQGKELTAKELEKENEREHQFRRRMTRVDIREKAARKEGWITQELIDEFDFTFVSRETVHGRTTVVLRFAPARSGAAPATIQQKIMRRLAGTISVDEQDFEVARVEANLRSPVPLGWFGMVGSLDQFRLSLQRQRLPDGVWVNLKQTLVIAGRKLFDTMRIRATEEASGFARE